MSGRVVITGVGLASPIGNTFEDASRALQNQTHGIARMPQWGEYDGLKTRLAGLVTGLNLENRYPRKKARTMGRVALLSTYATERAIADAGLAKSEIENPACGIAYGSTHGSSAAQEKFCSSLFATHSLKGLEGSSYIKFMSHTCVANLAQFFGATGRMIPTTSACTSGSQAIGYGYEAIRNGMQDIMLCGGAEEMHFTHAVIFDIMYATSVRYNEQPELGSRPYDSERDGLVVAEGAGTVVLESLERAIKRGAKVYAEVIGYGTNCDGGHVVSPSSAGMGDVMRLALQDANLSPAAIDYINGHGTGTEAGDIAECQAVYNVMGEHVPISSTKCYTGHTLGACGVIEAIFCLAMMQDGFVACQHNLENVDPRCPPLSYLPGATRAATLNTVMSNNFAFGGINTSLILRRSV
ncbi:MAG: beta-ketoacyl-ACP synthase [Myxococcales bacterium]|nr:beta-ketoacyl-ACP synthase [Myxococcales bacterium]MCB9708875.1 beta-ketoacyl-ACP synthase [Myxococcales bacterium]